MMNATLVLAALLALAGNSCHAFAPSSNLPMRRSQMSQKQKISPNVNLISNQLRPITLSSPTTTTLHNGVIIDVDDNFFTIAFFSIGIFYSLGKAYNRYLLEEVAFEQRRFEARERRLESDPSLSEFDLRREESAQWPSVYARKFRGEGETFETEQKRSRRVSVLDRDEFDDEMEYNNMSDEEISDFESKYGVEYDPYYDEPYEEAELPVGKYKEDKSYGDRRYENGEVFYKDENSGQFYRQGSRPRQKKFWELNSS